MFFFKLSLLFFTLIALSSCQLFIDPSVIDLTKQNFSSTTGLPLPNITSPINATQNWFIIFYSPMCPHCVQTMPSWNDLATSLKQKPLDQPTKLGKGDCPAYPDLCKQFDVMGYPTMVLLTKGNEKKVFAAGRTVEEYRKFLSDIYAGIIPTVPVGQEVEESQVVKEIRFYFENITWTGILMLAIMCVLISMLVYVIFDKEEEGKQFTSVVALENRQTVTEL